MKVINEAAARRLRHLESAAMAACITRLDGMHLDSNDVALLDRQLRYVESKIYDVLYPLLKHRQFIPTDNSVPEGAETVSYRMFDQVRSAKLITDFADDLPSADAFVTEFPIPIKPIGSSYKYSLRDLQHAAFSGVQLDLLRARAARNSVEYELDDIACFGRPQVGLLGFLNNQYVDIDAAGGHWASRTPAQIIADVNTLLSNIIVGTKEIWQATDVVLPTDLFEYIARTPFSATGASNYTILVFLQTAHPDIRFSSWTKLNAANAAGTGGRIVAYNRSPEVLQEKIPMEFRQLPPQPKNLAFVINCWALTAGTHLYQPKAVRYMDGAN